LHESLLQLTDSRGLGAACYFANCFNRKIASSITLAPSGDEEVWGKLEAYYLENKIDFA